MGRLTRTDERPDIATASLGRPAVGLLAFEEIGDLDHRARVDAWRVDRQVLVILAYDLPPASWGGRGAGPGRAHD
jgi:hypothetical protein